MLRAHRTSFVGRFSAGIVVALVPIAAACNGHVSLGSSGDTLQPITTSKAADSVTGSSGSVTCAAGWAHPNICCSAGPDVASQCGYYAGNPFLACATGSTTYPDLLSCCNLKDPSNCNQPTAVSPPPTPPPAYACGFACPPGWWAQAAGGINPGYGEEGAMCCTTYGSGTECVPQGYSAEPVTSSCGVAVGVSSGSSGTNGSVADGGVVYPTDASISPPPEDAGWPVPGEDAGWPAPSEDAGWPLPTEDAGTLPGGWIDDAGCYYGEDAGAWVPPDGWDGGITALCSACPSGWVASDSSQPELCCQLQSNGLTECFSQASGSATSVGSADDAGVSTVSVPPSSGGSSSSGSPTSGWGTAGASSADGAPSPSCSGSATSCSCEETVNGQLYALDCYTGSGTSASCSCSINGSNVGTSFSIASCNDSTDVTSAFTAGSGTGCGFSL